MPDPNGDGLGSPISNVAFGDATSEAAAVTPDSVQGVQSHGEEVGIIIVGGNSASPDAGSFWDQAASHAGSEATPSSAVGSIANSTVYSAAVETSAASVHDFSSVAADHGAATQVSVVAVHADFASMAHYETPSFAGGEFATHLHI
jgi:hypothetical protein